MSRRVTSLANPEHREANDMPMNDKPQMVMPRGVTVSLADFGDDSLRAECERRGIALPQLQSIADGYKRERDEWKRRAEAAEAESALLRAAPIPAGRQMTIDPDAFRKLRANLRERGPGIAITKPDNSIAWLDEDLLCEDVS